jgi:hypothetical protein
MRWWLIGGVLGLAALGDGRPATAAELKRTGWLTDYPAARAAARRAGKPVFVVFRCEP